jgi:hypothetical protein
MQDNEDIKCPHCHGVWGTEKTAGLFSTSKLTVEQQRAYKHSFRSRSGSRGVSTALVFASGVRRRSRLGGLLNSYERAA